MAPMAVSSLGLALTNGMISQGDVALHIDEEEVGELVAAISS